MSQQRQGQLFRTGLNVVYSPPQPGGAVATVIFIHGLFGHPWKTWADESSKDPVKPFWPQTLLPTVLPDTQIYSFGYDADVGKFMSAVGLNTVLQHGTNLLNNLADLLDETGSLPLLFVVHSLGGLVLKEALNQSSTTHNKRNRKVVELTRGIVFLGTPHKGSGTASYGKIAFTLTKLFAAQSANTKLLRALEKDSEMLDRITKSFYETWERQKQIEVKSFFEEKETRKLGLFGVRVVPPECALIGHAREETGSIPADHRYMAKYRSPEDCGFKEVSKVLRRWVGKIQAELNELDQRKYQDCLDSLDEPDARVRVRQVSTRHKDSFEWLFTDRVPFVKWLTDTEHQLSPIFWITGKPGSGKSTAMRFALQDPRLQTLLPNTKPIAYFFHLRGKNVAQKSFRGMLAELLFQLLADDARTFSYVESFYRDLVQAQRTKAPSWDIATLQNAILSVSDGSLVKRTWRYIIFIDALDENANEPENRQIVSFVKELAKDGIKICLASRPWPVFQKELGSDPRIPRFAIHDFTTHDIESFASSHLLAALPAGEVKADYESVIRLARKVSDKARGVFVWVRLVVQELSRNIENGTTWGMLDGILAKLPEELRELYEYTMKRVPSAYGIEAVVACGILLSSLTPLTLESLQCATIACISGTYEKSARPSQVAWLKSRTGGLIEEVDAVDDEAVDDDGVDDRPVQFIHQTAEEFVRKGMPGLLGNEDIERWQSTNQDGSIYIFRAIAARHPPFPPLITLSRQLFYHLRNIDLILDRHNATPHPELLTMPGILRPQFSQRSSILLDIYGLGRSVSKKDYLGSSTYMLPYVDLEDVNTFTRDSLGSFRSSRINALWAALVFHGVCNVSWKLCTGATPSKMQSLLVLLGAAALGKRARSASITANQANRLRMVDNILIDLEGVMAAGRDAAKRDELRASTLIGCLVAADDALVDEATRLAIFERLCCSLSSDLPSIAFKVNSDSCTPEGAHDIVTACGFAPDTSDLQRQVRMDIIQFCARFKTSRAWLDVITRYLPMEKQKRTDWWLDLPATLGSRDAVVAKDECKATLYRQLSKDRYEEEEEKGIAKFGAGVVLPGLVGGCLGFRQLYRVGYPGEARMWYDQL